MSTYAIHACSAGFSSTMQNGPKAGPSGTVRGSRPSVEPARPEKSTSARTECLPMKGKENIAYVEGYFVGRNDLFPRQPMPDFKAAYEKGVADGSLARAMAALVEVSEMDGAA